MNWLTISKMLDRIGTFEMKSDSGLVERNSLLLSFTVEEANSYCNRKYGRDLTPQEITDIQRNQDNKLSLLEHYMSIVDEVVGVITKTDSEDLTNKPLGILTSINENAPIIGNQKEELIEKDNITIPDNTTQGDEDESKN